jgi:rSAM/selenodomain-associated transferase 2
MTASTGDGPVLSVVIPALNEAASIEACIASVATAEASVEIIVADGGSTDGTAERAARLGARIVLGPRGRSAQVNAGGHAAQGGTLLFLHADTLLPEGYDRDVLEALSDPAVAGGGFALGIAAPGFGFRFIEAMANLRSRTCSMPFGDQALFVRRETFLALGGFPDMPIMEDFAFVDRLRRTGRVVTLPRRVRTSPRRWHALGLVRVTLTNKVMIWGYKSGVSPERLARWYARSRGLGPAPHKGLVQRP